jgi:hypothetical protein
MMNRATRANSARIRRARFVATLVATATCASFSAGRPARAAPEPAVEAAADSESDASLAGAGGSMAARSSLGSVTVEADRERATIERQVSGFVSALAVRPTQESLVRWGRPICPLVGGLTHDQGEFMLARLSELIRTAGATLDTEKCRPNFYVIATADPDAFLKAWRKRDARLFGEGTGPAIRRFLGSDQAVRVWYNASLDTSTGMPMTGSVDLGYAPTTSGVQGGLVSGANTQAFAGLPTNSHAKLTRLQWDELQQLGSVIVILDTRRARGLNFGQLSDYIGMVGLTEVRQDADLGSVPSILRLFGPASSAAPAGLSAWDQAYLKALYSSDQSDRLQLSVIKTRVVRDLLP